MKGLKEGDKILCHKKCIMTADGAVETTVGKIYTIFDFDEEDNCLIIKNDHDNLHLFSLRPKSHSYYKRWFFNPRKTKLIKIKENL